MNCLCNHCSAPIEFEDFAAGEKTRCPHCGMETILYEKPETKHPDQIAKEQAAAQNEELSELEKIRREAAKTQSPEYKLLEGKSIDLGPIVVGAFIIGFIWVVALLMFTSGSGSGTGSAATAGFISFVIMIVGSVLSIMWLLFPFIVYAQMSHQVRLLQYIAKRLKSNKDGTN